MLIPNRVKRLPAIIAIIALLMPAGTMAQQKRGKTNGSQPTAEGSKNSEKAANNGPSLATIIRKLAKGERLNVLFDTRIQAMVDSTKVNFDQEGVSPLRAIQHLLDAYQLTYQPLDRRTILISNRMGNYEAYISLEELLAKAEQLERAGKTKPAARQFRLRDYSFRDAPLSIIIRTLAEQEKINVVFEDQIAKLAETKKVNFELKATTAPRALKILLDANRLEYTQVDLRTIMITIKSNIFSPSLEEMLGRAEELEQLSYTAPTAASSLKQSPITPSTPIQAVPAITTRPEPSSTQSTTPSSDPIKVIVRVLNPKVMVNQIGLLGVILSSNQQQIIGVSVSLRYNPKVIKITAVKDGGLLSLSNAPAELKQIELPGTVSVNISRAANAVPVQASGQLVLIYYEGVGPGKAGLNLSEIELVGKNNSSFPASISCDTDIEVVGRAPANTPNSGDDDEDE